MTTPIKLAIFSRSEQAEACLVKGLPDGLEVQLGAASMLISAEHFKPREMQFLCASNRRLGLIRQSVYVDARDWPAVMRQMDFDKVIAGLYFGDTADEAALVVSEPCNTEVVGTLEVAPAPYGVVAASIYPSAVAVRQRNAAKMELVRAINPLDSLAALEKQVDVLSTLVLELAALIPAAKTMPLMQKVRAMLEGSGSNAGKTDDQVLASISDYKKTLRQAQIAYFAKRDGGGGTRQDAKPDTPPSAKPDPKVDVKTGGLSNG
jgi:hypothetical protein